MDERSLAFGRQLSKTNSQSVWDDVSLGIVFQYPEDTRVAKDEGPLHRSDQRPPRRVDGID